MNARLDVPQFEDLVKKYVRDPKDKLAQSKQDYILAKASQRKREQLARDTAERKKELLDLISLSRRRQERYFEMFANAAMLASQQVQDKRITFLEKDPEVTASDIFMDLLFQFALGAIVGYGASVATKAILTRVLRTRLMFRTGLQSEFTRSLIRSRATQLAAKKAQFKFIADADNIRESFLLDIRVTKAIQREASTSILQSDLELRYLFKDIVFQITDGIPAGTSKAGRKAVEKMVQKPPLPIEKTFTQGMDTPGVSLVHIAQLFSTNQKFVSNYFHDLLDSAVHLEPYDNRFDDLKILLEKDTLPLAFGSNEPNTDPIDLTQSVITEQWKRQFEMIIWVLLLENVLTPHLKRYAETLSVKQPEEILRLPSSERNKRRRDMRKGLRFEEGNIKGALKDGFLLGPPVIPKNLVDYWLHRFFDPATEEGESFMQYARELRRQLVVWRNWLPEGQTRTFEPEARQIAITRLGRVMGETLVAIRNIREASDDGIVGLDLLEEVVLKKDDSNQEK